ncbi:hypothetical protein WN51_08928 [Melipona quadrifasciata]|uniref:Uncharacterized protein n=1 Tax=Melipona quadrifasciata TaxID=166423 RepID=A0A0M8ZMU3_9HYME|nr:hypothetical protein WN51_08928 [Melipona quadrifasciata]
MEEPLLYTVHPIIARFPVCPPSSPHFTFSSFVFPSVSLYPILSSYHIFSVLLKIFYTFRL